MKLSTEDSRTATAAVERAYRATRSGGTPAWLVPLQDQALAAFARSGFPTARHEDWKYTNLARLAGISGELLEKSAHAADTGNFAESVGRLPRRTGDYTLVFVNGRFHPALSELPDGADGIRVTTLAQATDEDRERFSDWIGSSTDADMAAFAALNTAFLTDGICIDILPDTQPAAALHVIFVTDGPPIGTQARMLVNAGQRSSARIFEHHVGRGTGWTNAMTELRCGEASQLTYVKLQNEHHEADHIAAQHVRLGVDSVFRAAHIDLGARLARNDLKIGMTGSGARAELFGLFLADGRRHVDHHTRTDHRAAHTVSREHYRGILSEHGRGVFNGKVIVHEQAGGTDARLDNRNLLLAKTAEIDTKPELEIYTDDVKCAHGATTGQLDEQALFYLRARGIPRHAARRMLVLAFARDIFQQFDAAESELVDYVNRALERRLPN